MCGPCRPSQNGHHEPKRADGAPKPKEEPKEAPVLARCALRPGVAAEEQCDKAADGFAIRGAPNDSAACFYTEEELCALSAPPA